MSKFREYLEIGLDALGFIESNGVWQHPLSQEIFYLPDELPKSFHVYKGGLYFFHESLIPIAVCQLGQHIVEDGFEPDDVIEASSYIYGQLIKLLEEQIDPAKTNWSES